jgi:GxxExxY protein
MESGPTSQKFAPTTKGDPRTFAIIGAAMGVHGELGSGFLEAVYQEALAIELARSGIPYVREPELPVSYKGQRLGATYRPDFICFDAVIVELKAIKAITPIEEAQAINYLKASGYPVALVINFGAESLQYKRLANLFERKNAESQSV